MYEMRKADIRLLYKRENPGEGDNYFVDVYRFVMDIDESDLHPDRGNRRIYVCYHC